MPKGTLMLIGGGYPPVSLADLQADPQMPAAQIDPLGLYRDMLAQSSKDAPVVTLITNASRGYADETAQQQALIFKSLGAKEVHTISTQDAAQMKTDVSIAQKIRSADIVYVTGGDQEHLAELFKNTEAYQALLERYSADPDFTLAGTSAGSMIMARDMIAGPPKKPGDPTPLAQGFGFIPAVVETHMGMRAREPRMLSALDQREGNIGIGLDNATALIIKNGHAQVKGEGRVLIASRSETMLGLDNNHQLDLSTLPSCEPYKDKGMQVHSYKSGDKLELQGYTELPSATHHRSVASGQQIRR